MGGAGAGVARVVVGCAGSAAGAELSPPEGGVAPEGGPASVAGRVASAPAPASGAGAGAAASGRSRRRRSRCVGGRGRATSQPLPGLP